MKPRMLALAAALAAVALVPVVAAAAVGPVTVDGKRPGRVADTNIGRVITTPGRLGFYYWDVEKAGRTIRCKGSCLVAWPPVYVKGPVAKRVKGVGAVFGTIRRGARLQLTVNGLPAYLYQGDAPGIVRCDGVDGWHAFRPSS